MGTSLVKGQNGPLTVSNVVVSVRSTAAADVSALLVTAAGRVRTDADFVFFNQPNAPGVELRSGTPASLAVSSVDVPAEIAQIRVVITLDDAAATFGQFAAPVATVADGSGNTLYEYVLGGWAASRLSSRWSCIGVVPSGRSARSGRVMRVVSPRW